MHDTTLIESLSPPPYVMRPQVYLLGEGEESRSWLSTPGRTVQQLFLSHVTRVAKGVREAWPNLNMIMWDDMLRGMDHDTLKGQGTGS